MAHVDVDATFSRPHLDAATEHLRVALESDPANPIFRLTLAEALLAARQNQEALELLRDAPAPLNGNRATWMQALAAHRLGETELASDLLSTLDDEEELGFTRFHELWGRIHFDREEYSDSVNAFARARMLHPESKHLCFLNARSLVSYAETCTQDISSLYRRALTLLDHSSPESSRADEWHFYQGRCQLALGYPGEALKHFERSRTPDDHQKSVLTGLAYLLVGHRDMALGFLQHGARGEHRALLAGYLAEIVAAPRDDLNAMRGDDAPTADLTLDRHYLAEIFGGAVPEVEDIIAASTRWREDPLNRTQLESTVSTAKGRLLAIEATGDDGDSEDQELGAETLRSIVIESETETSQVRSAEDSTAVWNPQTILDTGIDALDSSQTRETESFPATGDNGESNDEWDLDT